MKRFLLTACMVVTTLTSFAATNEVVKIVTPQVINYALMSEISEITFSADGKTLNVKATSGSTYTMDRTRITEISYIKKDDMPSKLKVNFNGESAQVENPFFLQGIFSFSFNGAYVTVTNSDETTEYTTSLSGSTSNGGFTYNGSYKCTVELNGVSITSQKGAAVDIECGKRVALEIKKNTTNSLVDCSGGSQKACLYCKGHLEIDKTGTLNVTGKTAHAISAKEYIQVKKGTINVLGAAKDGIHCKQYFLGEDGAVTISGVTDDGIQVEVDGDTPDAAIEDEDYKDGTFNVVDGTYTITTTGNGVKGIKADGSINISGGTFTITQSGSYLYDGTDIDYVTALKSGTDVNITGGSITINNTADGGKGISADGNVNISGDATVIDSTVNGKGGSAQVNAESSGETSEPETVKSYKVYVALPTSGGGMGGPGGGPGGSGSNAWTTVALYKSDGTLVANLSSTVSLTSGYTTRTFYYYDFKASDSGTYYFQSANYTSQGWGGSSTTYTIKSTTFTGPTSGEDYYYEVSSSYTTSGTTRTYTLSNVTNTWNGSEQSGDASGKAYKAVGIKADGNVNIAGGSIKITSTGTISNGINTDGNITISGGTVEINNSGTGLQGTNDSYTAKGLNANGNIALEGGNITIKMSGNGGKGIKVDGTYTQGTSDGNGPTLIVSTTGSSFGTSSSSSGGFGPGGGGMESSGGSSAKAIKAMLAATVYGGTSYISTSTDGAEGLESKTSITIKGGNHYFKCYDDCINSSGKIEFAGGNTVCYSTGNDAIDSNQGQSGAITFSGGNVFGYTSKGGAEEGFDCDNNSYIKITGGTCVSAGGSQGGGGGGWVGSSTSSSVGSSTQGYFLGSSPSSYGTSYYYTLCNTSGTAICTYKFEGSVSNSLGLLTATNLGKGSVTVKYGTSAPTACTAQVNNASGTPVFFINPTVTTTSTTATVTAK